MKRSPAYQEPTDNQIYDSSGEVLSIEQWRARYAPRPDQIDRQSDIGRAVDIGLQFLLIFAVILAVVHVVRLMWRIA